MTGLTSKKIKKIKEAIEMFHDFEFQSGPDADPIAQEADAGGLKYVLENILYYKDYIKNEVLKSKMEEVNTDDIRGFSSAHDLYSQMTPIVDDLEEYIEEIEPIDGEILNNSYVSKSRIKELEDIDSQYDLSRLTKLCKELNLAFSFEMYHATGMLVRSIIDHIPPIFNCKKFNEVANNYKGTKSFKKSMKYLNNSSRNIADSYLHTPIREKENLPVRKQIDFSNDLDVLLEEICRILKD